MRQAEEASRWDKQRRKADETSRGGKQLRQAVETSSRDKQDDSGKRLFLSRKNYFSQKCLKSFIFIILTTNLT